MGAFTLKIKGLTELQGRLDKASQKLIRSVDADLKDGAQAIAQEAKQRAPGDQGILRQEIGSVQKAQLRYSVYSGALYSAYVEFGTRTQVSVPPELIEYASQFRNTIGGSLGAKEAIFAWCKRKGIDPKAWYSIFISIMVKGTKPYPFFFPAFKRQQPIIIQNVKNSLAEVI